MCVYINIYIFKKKKTIYIWQEKKPDIGENIFFIVVSSRATLDRTFNTILVFI